jgi:hypothetical protein
VAALRRRWHGELARRAVADLGDGPAMVGDEVLDQPPRRGEEVAAGGRAGAGRPLARAVVVGRLVVDDQALAAELLVVARQLSVAHEGVQFAAGGVGGGPAARLAVLAAAGAAHDVPGLTLQPQKRQRTCILKILY